MRISSDISCTSFTPGHKVHWIHHRRLTGFDDWVDVSVYVDSDLDLIQLILGDRQQLMWFHDLPTLALALAGSGGQAQWCSRYSTLMVPGGFAGPARSSFFYLATPERVHPCKRADTAAGVAGSGSGSGQ